ncbi:DUF1203 domain-containing protein [Rhizobium oryzicola]|uniref:DUF1203 domain-containing protein n=1 Tax=Rhizobium oryzicola TaxID=1232668 RepID=A0ABT8T4H9_9HYPH|nr:DUF1203 domain-containing protein [Rhizobium oryzicola]MDO1585066.1 DUF1203 domain-containing protein [Rhizobium oryzicola]
MTIQFSAISTQEVEAYRAGASDAYGHAPERQISQGGMPCRHCLGMISEGEPMLLLAYRPFSQLQPYAETGPIFLHAEECPRYAAPEVLPPMLVSPDYIVRGYGQDDRIVYGTGAVTATVDIASRAGELLARDEIAYVHVRSARNNCYQCRVDRA